MTGSVWDPAGAARSLLDTFPEVVDPGTGKVDSLAAAARLGITVCSAEVPSGVDGHLVWTGGAGATDVDVFLGATRPDTRRRAACAEAVGHYLLAVDSSTVPEHGSVVWLGSSEDTGGGEQARRFARELLLPDGAGTGSAAAGFPGVAEVARRYGVPADMVARRSHDI